jgi:hypothetical protein
MRQQGYFLCAVLEPSRYLLGVDPSNFTVAASWGITSTCHSAELNVSSLFTPHPLMFPNSMWGQNTTGQNTTGQKPTTGVDPTTGQKPTTGVDPTLMPTGYSPDVIYFTWGMHALHMHPLRKFAFPLSSVLYEQALRDALEAMAKVSQAKVSHLQYPHPAQFGPLL